MNALKTLALAICVLSAAYTVLMMLVPDRYRSELRSVLSLAALVTVGAIALGADFDGISPGLSDLGRYNAEFSGDSLVQAELEARVSDYLSTLLSERGIECKKVSVGTTIDAQRRIFITKASLRLDRAFGPREAEVRALIDEKIGEIEVEIVYEES